MLKLFIPENYDGGKITILKNKNDLDVLMHALNSSTGEAELCGCL